VKREDWEALGEILKSVRATFSKNCCSGLVGNRCQCWRCRKSRGEEATAETEAEAERISKEAQAAMRNRIRRQFDTSQAVESTTKYPQNSSTNDEQNVL
jgi:hypothetical protein